MYLLFFTVTHCTQTSPSPMSSSRNIVSTERKCQLAFATRLFSESQPLQKTTSQLDFWVFFKTRHDDDICIKPFNRIIELPPYPQRSQNYCIIVGFYFGMDRKLYPVATLNVVRDARFKYYLEASSYYFHETRKFLFKKTCDASTRPRVSIISPSRSCLL